MSQLASAAGNDFLQDWQWSQARVEVEDSAFKRRSLHLTLFCCWLLMLVTFNVPGRDQQVLSTLDIVGFAKVIARATSLAVMVTLLPRLWGFANRPATVKILLPMILFVGFAIASTLWSPLFTVSLGQSGSLTAMFMLTAGLGILCTTPRDTSTVVCSISTALLIISTVLLLTRILVPSVHSISRDGAGVFHATSSGATASLGIIFLVASRFLWNWKWSRCLLPGTLIHAAVLVLAVNRTSLALTLFLVFYITLWYSNRAVALACMFGLSTIAIVYLVADPNLEGPKAILGSAASYANRGQTTADIKALSGRQEMWNAIWKAYQESIWVGHGYAVCSPTGRLFVWLEWANWTAHNVVLQCLMSTGLVGFFLLLWSFIRIGRLWVASRLRGFLSSELTAFVMVIFFWNLVWGMFNSAFLGPVTPEGVTFYVVMGLAVGRLSSCQPGALVSTVEQEDPAMEPAYP